MKYSKEQLREKQDIIKRNRQMDIVFNMPANELYEIKQNEKLHGTLYNVVKAFRVLNGCKKDFPEKDFLDKIYEEHPEYKNRPIIVAPNHIRKQDIEIVMEAVPIRMILLSGDYDNVQNDIGGFLLNRNGIIYFDMNDVTKNKDIIEQENYLSELNEYIELTNSDSLRDEYNKEKALLDTKLNSIINDRKNIKYIINSILSNNYNMLWFYEGSWNLSPNKPYYNGSYYMVQAAINNNAIVLPVGYDYFDENKKKKAVVRIGEPIDYRKLYGNRELTKEEKIEALDILKGQIGNCIYSIWEENAKVNRDDLVADEFYFDKYKEKVLSEWHFTEEQINEKHFIDKSIVEQEEAFDHLNKLKLDKNNAFLISKRNHK